MTDTQPPRASAPPYGERNGPRISAGKARQAGPGWHVFVIWAVSTCAAGAALFLIYAVLAAP